MDQKVGAFVNAAGRWVCDGYSASIRYLILRDHTGRAWLSQLLVQLVPFEVPEHLSFRIDGEDILVGQVQLNNLTRTDFLRMFSDAIEGQFRLDGVAYHFYSQEAITKSDMEDVARWDRDLHLAIHGADSSRLNVAYGRIENQLREAVPPFDGLHDLVTWLEVANPTTAQHSSGAVLRVSPPVELALSNCTLHQNFLTLKLLAHRNVEVSKIGIAVRTIPGQGLEGRQQLSSRVNWEKTADGTQVGHLHTEVVNAQAVLIMLVLSGEAVKRTWIIDPEKADNKRMIATRAYDQNLNQVYKAIDGTDSKRLESAISSILFMRGFASSPQVETEAPDIIVVTPSGRLAVIESTLKTSDVPSKLGKLVHRRNVLNQALQSAGGGDVLAVLACAASRDQIASTDEQFRQYRVALLDRTELLELLGQSVFPTNADAIFDSWLRKITEEPDAVRQT